MKWLASAFDFYLNASIQVALAVFALVNCTALLMGIPLDKHLSYFLFFGTISCYNFIKYGVEAEKYLILINEYHKKIQLISVVALLFACYHAFFLSIDTWIGIGAISLITGLYALPIIPRSKNLRNIGILKIILVALVWAGATVILPVIAVNKIIEWDVWIETLQRFIFVLILLVPFEIRDLRYDPPSLGTLPQRFGSTNSKSMGALGAVLFFFLTFMKDDISQVEIIGKGILFLVLGFAMFMTRRNQSKYFASFWIEAIPVVWWGVLVFLGFWI